MTEVFSDMEAIVRKIRTRKPTADIIFIYTATKVSCCDVSSRMRDGKPVRLILRLLIIMEIFYALR